MGESLKHVQASAELAQVTTDVASGAAEVHGRTARDVGRARIYDKAIPLFREAIAIDTGFASAYRALAIALGNRGRDRDGQIRRSRKRMRTRTGCRRSSGICRSRRTGIRDPARIPTKAAQAYESLLAIRPTHYAALNNLALIYAQRRDFAKAEALSPAVDRGESDRRSRRTATWRPIRPSRASWRRWSRRSRRSSRCPATIRASHSAR